MDLRREVFRGTVAKVLRMGVGIVATVLFARILGPTSFGGVYLLFTLAAFLDRPMMGWAGAAKKRISENDTSVSEALGSVLAFDFAWVVVVGAVAVLADEWVREFTGIANAVGFLVFIIATSSAVSTFWVVMEGKGRIAASVWSMLANTLSTVSIQLLLVLYGFAATGMLLGRAAGAALLIPLYLYVIGAVPALPSRRTVRSFWAFAKYNIPSSFFGRLYDRLDIFLLGVLISPTVAGYYEVAWKIATPGIILAEVGGRGLMTKVSASDAAGQSFEENVENTISFTSVVAIPLLLGALVVAEPLVVVVFGSEYLPAAPLLVGLCVYQLVRSQSYPLINVISGLDNIQAAMRLAVIAVAVNAVLGVVLTLEYGPIGVVISSIVAETVRYVGSVSIVSRSVADFTPVTRPMLVQFGVGAGMALVVWLLRAVTPDTWWGVIGTIAVGAIIYVIGMVAFSSRTRRFAVRATRRTVE